MCMVKHSLNSAYVLVDLLICATPVRILHMVYPIFFGLSYAVFNAIYFLSDGEGHDGKQYTYNVMHWQDSPAMAAGMCFVGFVVSAGMQIVLYATYEVRLYFASLCTRRKGQAAVTDTTNSLQRHKEATVGSVAEIERILPPVLGGGGVGECLQIDIVKLATAARQQHLTDGPAGPGKHAAAATVVLC